MALSISNFLKRTPKIPYLFTAEIYDYDDYKKNSTKAKYIFPPYSIQTLKLPTMENADNDLHIFLGNGMISMPLFNPASRTIEITFEETNSMSITNKLTEIMYNHYYGKNTAYKFCIVVNDDNETRSFICMLRSFENPSFSNTGSANICTVSASFIVLREMTCNADNVKAFSDIAIDSLTVENKEGWLDYAGGPEFKQQDDGITKDFVISNDERDNLYILLEHQLGRQLTDDEKKTVFDAVNENIEKLKAAHEKYIKQAEKIYGKYFKNTDDFKKYFNIHDVNNVVNSNHGSGFKEDGNASHNDSAKVDSGFISDDRLNQLNSEDQRKFREEMNNALHEAGLTGVLEKGKNTWWVDASLKEYNHIYIKNGEVKVKVNNSAWENSKNAGNLTKGYYDTNAKNFIKY